MYGTFAEWKKSNVIRVLIAGINREGLCDKGLTCGG